MSSDQLIGDIVEVVADNRRLGTDSQEIVADPLDQRRLPACRYRSKCVPGVAGDHAELPGLGAELALDIGISLTRRLVVLHAVGTEAALEQINDAAMGQLAGLHLEQVVGEREQPEARVAQLAECHPAPGAAASSKTSP